MKYFNLFFSSYFSRQLLFSCLFIVTACSTQAAIRPSVLVSDHMVLQQGAEIPIWGWADKGEKVTVSLNGQTLKTKPDKNGKWMVTFSPMNAGGPYEMTLMSKQSNLTIKNVMIGEVWICSGQSNMEWILKNTNEAEKEITRANYPAIRHFKVPKRVSLQAQTQLDGGKWEVCSPETAHSFTAVGYYFAKALHKNQDVAIGLINASWGGTIAETWMSAGAAKEIPAFRDEVESLADIDMKTYLDKQEKALVDLVGEGDFTQDRGMKNGKARWATPELDTKGWKTMSLPGTWERNGLPHLDGIVWFRKIVNIPEEFRGKKAYLQLAKIDDKDITWVNGFQVGTTSVYNEDRLYSIPSELLKDDKLVITVRVEDNGGGGGFWGDPKHMLLSTLTGEEISLAGEWQYKVGKVASVKVQMKPNTHPTLLYNGMIHALIPYKIKGAIWYQGESNANRAYQYRTIFPKLIQNWRQLWKQGDFPFLFVQLANFQKAAAEPEESTWAELREAQSMALDLPNTGQAVIIDIGEANDIHPRNKKEVGERLALNARKIAYGENIVHSGPVYQSMSIEGSKIRIQFEETGSGLVARDKYGYLKGFTIAGKDQTFVWARAELEGDEVLVYSTEVKNPIAVRYAWANNPEDANLYNKEGLPASPFRTDTWEGVTKNNF